MNKDKLSGEKYLPHRKYEDNAFLESGGYWLRQTHIFDSPFYYIDYTIAQVVAFEFFIESLDNYKATFEKYLKFDRLGGAYPYKELSNGNRNNRFNNTKIKRLPFKD